MRNRDGFSLVEMLIAGSVAGVLMLGSASIMQMLKTTESKIESFRGLSNIRSQLEFHFNDPRAVANSIAVNATMACLSTLSENCVYDPDGRPFELFDSSQNSASANKVPAFDQAPNIGFKVDGSSCNDFGTAGSKCVLRYETKWIALCGNDTSRCRAPSYRLVGKLLTADPALNINLKLYDVEIVRSASGEQAADVCTGFGGTFSDGKCAVLLSKTCPNPKDLFIGVDSDNKKICRGVIRQTCPRGTVIRSISTDGNVVCQPGCYLNVTCTFNMWTGVSDCPTDVGWVSGQGIVGTNPNLDPNSAVPPAPPAPPPAPDPPPPPPSDPPPPSGDGGGDGDGGAGGGF